MDDALVPSVDLAKAKLITVLILVLMDDALVLSYKHNGKTFIVES